MTRELTRESIRDNIEWHGDSGCEACATDQCAIMAAFDDALALLDLREESQKLAADYLTLHTNHNRQERAYLDLREEIETLAHELEEQWERTPVGRALDKAAIELRALLTSKPTTEEKSDG